MIEEERVIHVRRQTAVFAVTVLKTRYVTMFSKHHFVEKSLANLWVKPEFCTVWSTVRTSPVQSLNPTGWCDGKSRSPLSLRVTGFYYYHCSDGVML